MNLFSFIDFICIDTPFLSICSFNSNQFVSSLKGLLHASLSRFGTQEESKDGLIHCPYDGDDPKDGDYQPQRKESYRKWSKRAKFPSPTPDPSESEDAEEQDNIDEEDRRGHGGGGDSPDDDDGNDDGDD